MPTLLPYEVKTIDIGAALVAGEKNRVTVWGGVHRSQMMISDVMPKVTNTFTYLDEPLYYSGSLLTSPPRFSPLVKPLSMWTSRSISL